MGIILFVEEFISGGKLFSGSEMTDGCRYGTAVCLRRGMECCNYLLEQWRDCRRGAVVKLEGRLPE